MKKTVMDSFSMQFTSDAEFAKETAALENESEWMLVRSKNLSAFPVASKDEAAEFEDEDGPWSDTSVNLKLGLLTDGDDPRPLRDTAFSGLCEAAKLSGTSLLLMRPEVLAQTLNNGLDVAKGKSLVLFRAGKVTAIHSDTYLPMETSKLWTVTTDILRNDFGTVEFRSGELEHDHAKATVYLPDFRDEIMDAYEDALKGAVSNTFPMTGMPAVRFLTSDTADSVASLLPVFSSRDMDLSFVSPVGVKHSVTAKYDGRSGVDAFREQAKCLYAKFKASIKKVEELAHKEVENPVNAVVSLCNTFRIPRKYGERARKMVEEMSSGALSAHDVYLAMTVCLAQARRDGTSDKTVNNLSEQLAKVVTCDWSAHDVGGVVAWK